MGHRLSKIYTRTGDAGTTGLGDGSRVDKDNIRIEAFGTVDELNSVIGVLITECPKGDIADMLTDIQHELFDLGGELCIPGRVALHDPQVDRLEQWLDMLNAPLPPLKEFILPGGGRAAAQCHVARTVCRRAERLCVSLGKTSEVNAAGLKYLNRLSDLLFVMARALNVQVGCKDVLWQPGKTQGKGNAD
jgi:cob(I)alamin adenosyltransferase